MENLSKLTREDLLKLQKGVIEELNKRNDKEWIAAAENFKKAFDDLLRVGLGAPQIMVSITDENEEWETVEYSEVFNISIDKENKQIIIEVEEVFI